MGKTYKGWELIKAIADGKIKNRSRFKAGYRTFIARDGYLFTECSDRQEYATTFELAWDFELIEDEIDIDSITENEWMTSSERNFKINQLVQAVKQIDKRVKKLEKE